MRTYCQEVNQEVVVADLFPIGTFTYHLLVEKAPDLWKKGTNFWYIGPIQF